MLPNPPAEQRALEVLQRARFYDPAAIIDLLRAEGLIFADARREEFVVRWVSIAERATPPEADTIIRTITRTLGTHQFTSTHWLDGLRGPKV